MTIDELLMENQEILQRMKNEEWNLQKFIKELKGENNYSENPEFSVEMNGKTDWQFVISTAPAAKKIFLKPIDKFPKIRYNTNVLRRGARVVVVTLR